MQEEVEGKVPDLGTVSVVNSTTIERAMPNEDGTISVENGANQSKSAVLNERNTQTQPATPSSSETPSRSGTPKRLKSPNRTKTPNRPGTGGKKKNKKRNENGTSDTVDDCSSIKSFKFTKNEEGEYFSSKANVSHYSMIQFLKRLPKAAGIRIELGISPCSTVRNRRKSELSTKLRDRWMQKHNAQLFDTSILDPRIYVTYTDWLKDPKTWIYLAFRTDQRGAYSLSRTFALRAIYDLRGSLCMPESIRCLSPNANQMMVIDDKTPAEHSSEFEARRNKTESEAYFFLANAARGRSRTTESIIAIQQSTKVYGSHRHIEAIRKCWMQSPTPLTIARRRMMTFDRRATLAYSMDLYSMNQVGRRYDSGLLLQKLVSSGFVGDFHFCREVSRSHLRLFTETLDIVHLSYAIDGTNHALRLIEWPEGLQLEGEIPKSASCSMERLSVTDARPFSFQSALVYYRDLCYERAIRMFNLYLKMENHLGARIHASVLLAFSFQYNGKHIEGYETLTTAIRWLRQSHVRTVATGKFVRGGFSVNDLYFLRGYMIERYERDFQKDSKPMFPPSSEDYCRVHNTLVKEVSNILQAEKEEIETAEYRKKNICAVIVTIGASNKVEFSNILTSRPIVIVSCQQSEYRTMDEPSWKSLSPVWEEEVKVNVSSINSRIRITLRNNQLNRPRKQTHSRRFTQESMDGTIGWFDFNVQNALKTGVIEPRYYSLQRPSSLKNSAWGSLTPELCLAFEIVVKAKTHTREETLKLNTPFNVHDWLQTSYIWEDMGMRFYHLNEFRTAKDLFLEAIKRRNNTDFKGNIDLMIHLAHCLRACKEYNETRKWLEKCLELVGCSSREEFLDQDEYEKKLVDLLRIVSSPCSAFEERVLDGDVASNWIKVVAKTPQGSLRGDYNERGKESKSESEEEDEEESVYYVNEESGEYAFKEPLWYETELERRYNIQRAKEKHLRRKLSSEMKHAVNMCMKEMVERHTQDRFQWIARWDTKELRYIYYSQVYQITSTKKPAEFSLVVEETTMIAVVSLQRILRVVLTRRRKRAKARLRLRMCIFSVYFAFALSRQAKQSVHEKNERERKALLAFIHLEIFSASQLRAADLVTSDPYVKIELLEHENLKHTVQTDVRKRTLNPKWDETFYIPYVYNEEIEKQEETSHASSENHEEREDSVLLVLTVMDRDEGEGQSDDFLGMASIPIMALTHGRAIPAKLTLRDEHGFDDTPRPRGTLSVEVKWIARSEVPEEEFEVQEQEKEDDDEDDEEDVPPPPPPLLPENVLNLFKLTYSTMTHTLRKVLDGVLFAEQLSKLDKAAKEAEEDPMKSEENETYKRRIQAVIDETFRPLEKEIRAQVDGCKMEVKLLLNTVFETIMQYAKDTKRVEEMQTICQVSESERLDDQNQVVEPKFEAIDSFVMENRFAMETWNGKIVEILKVFDLTQDQSSQVGELVIQMAKEVQALDRSNIVPIHEEENKSKSKSKPNRKAIDGATGTSNKSKSSGLSRRIGRKKR